MDQKVYQEKELIILIDDHDFRGSAIAAALASHSQIIGAEVLYKGPYEFSDDGISVALRDSRVSAFIHSIGGRSIADPEILETLRRLMAQIGGLPLIVMTDEPGQESLAMAVAIGVNGVVPTSMSSEVCLAAIRFIVVGGQYFPNPIRASQVRQAVAADTETATFGSSRPVPPVPSVRYEVPVCPQPKSELSTPAVDMDDDETAIEVRIGDVVSHLTPRQLDVMRLLERGLSNKEIGQKLDLSESTVKLHVRHLLRKLNVSNRTQIALLASSVRACTTPPDTRPVSPPDADRCLRQVQPVQTRMTSSRGNLETQFGAQFWLR